jgi:hypothetical protein
MKLEIEISESCLRKMKALDALTGGEGISDFESYLSSKIEDVITADIIGLIQTPLATYHEALGDTAPMKSITPLPDRYRQPERLYKARKQEPVDTLADEEDEDGDAQLGGLTLADIARDSQIDDPEHEAVSPDSEDEATFESFLGLPKDSVSKMERNLNAKDPFSSSLSADVEEVDLEEIFNQKPTPLQQHKPAPVRKYSLPKKFKGTITEVSHLPKE